MKRERIMNDGTNLKIIARGWAHVILMFATVAAGILLPLLVTMDFEAGAETLSVSAETDESNDSSLLSEVALILDRVQRAQMAHDQTVNSASDMKSVVDELEASKNALTEMERFDADSASGAEDSISADASGEEIEDCEVPMSEGPATHKSTFLIAPAR